MRQRSLARILPLALTGLLCPMATDGQETGPVLEIRCYNLKPGTRDAFHVVAEREALRLPARFGIDVVAHGPSPHDREPSYRVRALPTPEARQRAEDAFYGSDAWKNGPRASVLAAIESYTTVVVRTDDAMLGALRRGDASPSPAALAELLALNQDYIRSVQAGDVKRFREI